MDTNTIEKLKQIARRAEIEPKTKFTSLAHLLNPKYLKQSYKDLKRNKAAGIDGKKKEDYREEEINKAIEETVKQLKKKEVST